MSKPKRPLTVPASTLSAAGPAVVSGNGAELERVMRALNDAGAVVPRFGDNPADVRAFKLCCGVNYAEFDAAAKALAMRVRKVLEPTDNDPVWQALSERYAALGQELFGEAIPADVVLSLFYGDSSVRASLAGAYGEDCVAKLEAANTESLFPLSPDERHAQMRRNDALAAAGELLSEQLQVQVQMVAWDKAPGGLSGGYLRELAWMFATPPDRLQKLIDAAQAVAPVHLQPAPEPIDSAPVGVDSGVKDKV